MPLKIFIHSRISLPNYRLKTGTGVMHRHTLTDTTRDIICSLQTTLGVPSRRLTMPIKDTLPETMPAWSSEKTPDSSEPASTDYETSASEDCPPTPDSDPIPDGGHGWVVLCGCTVVAFFSIGTAQSWGVLQTALLEEGVSSSTNLLWVGSLSAGLVPALAILYARIMRMIGPHHAGMAGITVMSLSTAVSSVVYRSIGPLFAAYGVVMGLGMG